MDTGLIEFRQMSIDDASYLYDLCEVTMRGYVESVWGEWNECAAREFLSSALIRGAFSAIFENTRRIGVVSVEVNDTYHQLEQLYIAPEYQNRGLGAAVVKHILANAAVDSMPVRLRVLKPNPARRLYERLGFKVVDSTSERYFMEHSGE